MSNPLSREQRIFAQAVELPTDAERTAYLRNACGDDAALRQSVEELLRAHFAEENFVQAQVADDVEREESPLGKVPGTVIGRYKLLEQIGEGGFGVVYMAEQEEPVRRKVALKIIKLGMNTRQVIARFEAERQALALMDQANIAKVLDAGATDTGRPYFVMELVRGVPITQFCEENRLSIKERLELFIPVCHAIQHAHQKGVIHRDIKPSNVLVTLDNAVPHPMVIDFGVAKAIQQRLTEKTLHTRFAQMIGTPAYMSPEQAAMSKQDVDTRTDVYSLGIMLYELLTGTTPFPEDRLREAGYAKIQQIISQEEPTRPSTVVSRTNGRQRTMASHRRKELTSLMKHIKGDLDWIVLKAIEKDRNRRYATPNELALDIERHLADEPVTATPPSAVYRLSKFVRRNRGMVAAGAAVLAALAVGLAAASWQAMRAKQEARRAGLNEYVAEVSLAQRVFREDNLGHAKALLADDVPAPGDEDFRGWEWYHLWNQFMSDALFQLGMHTDPVVTVAWSPNGRMVASGDRGGGISLWDVSSRTLLASWAEQRCIHEVLLYSDELMVTGSENGKIRFYSLGQEQPRETLDLKDSVQAIALSPAKDRLAGLTGANGGETITVWTLLPPTIDGQLPATAHAYTVPGPRRGGALYDQGALAFSPDGQVLAAGYSNGEIHIYDAATGSQRRILAGSPHVIASLDFSPDGRWLASGAFQTGIVRVWDVAKGECAVELSEHARGARAVVFTKNGEHLLTGSGDHVIRLFGTKDWSLEREFRGHIYPIHTLALSPMDDTFVTGSKDQTILAWNHSRASARLEPIEISRLEAFQFSPSGALLATVEPGRDDPQKRRAGLRTSQNLSVWTELPDLGDQVTDVAFSPDERYLAALSRDAVRLWDLTSQRLFRAGDLAESDRRLLIGFTSDGGTLLLIDHEFNVTPWNVAATKTEEPWSARGSYRLPSFFREWSVSFHAPSSTLVLGSEGFATVWDIETRQRRGVLSGHQATGVSPSICEKGSLIATIGNDSRIILWDARTLARIRGFEIARPAHSGAFSPDSRRLAVGHGGTGWRGNRGAGTVSILDVETGMILIDLTTRWEFQYEVGWSPDGSVLMTQGTDGVIWRVPRIEE